MPSRSSIEVRMRPIGVAFAATVAGFFVIGAACSDNAPKPNVTNSYDATPVGSVEGWGDASVPETLTPTQACARYMRAVCERKNECGLGNDDCAKAVANCPDVLFSVGTTREPISTWECAFAMRQRSCLDVYLSTNPSCVTQGSRKSGETCIAAAQCESLACTGSSTSCGTCLQRAAKGKDCTDRTSVVCERGLSCDATTNTCIETPAQSFDDVVSTEVEIGKACDTKHKCATGAYCKVADGAGTCTARIAEGEACVTSGACIEGTYCFQEGNTCRKLPAAGSRCGNDVETGNAIWCTEDAYCDNGGGNMCRPLPEAGAACATTLLSGGPIVCAPSAICDSTASPPTCKALAGPADVCTADSECRIGLKCICADTTCTKSSCGVIRDIGESCTSPGEVCNAVSTCTDGICKANPSQGLFAAACGG